MLSSLCLSFHQLPDIFWHSNSLQILSPAPICNSGISLKCFRYQLATFCFPSEVSFHGRKEIWRFSSEFLDCSQNIYEKSCLPCQYNIGEPNKAFSWKDFGAIVFCRDAGHLGSGFPLRSRKKWQQETMLNYSSFHFLFTLSSYSAGLCTPSDNAKETVHW